MNKKAAAVLARLSGRDQPVPLPELGKFQVEVVSTDGSVEILNDVVIIERKPMGLSGILFRTI